MPLKATVESLESVEEQYRGLYAEKDGVYRLNVEGVEFEDDVKGLRNALERERNDRKAAERRLKNIPEDFDPEKWAALTDAQRKAEEEKAKTEGKWEDWKKQLQEQHAKEKDALNQRATALTQKIEHLLITSVAAQEIAKMDGSSKLLLPHVERMTKVVEDDGDFRVVVVDDDGKERLGKNGEPMSIAELVGEMRESDDFAAAFKGSGAAGGGAPGRGAAGGSGRSGVRTKADIKTMADRIAFIEEHGNKAYLDLPQA